MSISLIALGKNNIILFSNIIQLLNLTHIRLFSDNIDQIFYRNKGLYGSENARVCRTIKLTWYSDVPQTANIIILS